MNAETGRAQIDLDDIQPPRTFVHNETSVNDSRRDFAHTGRIPLLRPEGCRRRNDQ
jgi:hypothetical protein